MEDCLLCDGTKKICTAVVGSPMIRTVACPECTEDDDDGRYEAADMAYDMAVEGAL